MIGTEVYDIETLCNFYSYIGLNISTMKESVFVIHNSRNDLLILIDHLMSLEGQIGYNNLSFDSQVNQYIINNYKDWLNLNGEEIATLIYNYSQKVIQKSNNGEFLDYPEWKLSIKQLDLFKIWHFNNKAKATSLKWIQFMIDYPNIEEMPIHHTTKITNDMIQSILDYNRNDVLSTYEFYKITKGDTEISLYKGIDKIQLRKDIQKEFNINCINFNDVKIGDKINEINYINYTNLNHKNEIPKPNKDIKPFKFKDCFPIYMKFKTEEFNNFIKKLGEIDVNLKKSNKKSKDKQEFKLKYKNNIYTIAKGGLHSEDSKRIIIPKNNEILRDCDVGSMYPNAIRKRKLFPAHLGEFWLKGYTNIIQQRISAKKAYKETKEGKYKAIDEALKLSLNGGSFGKTGEETSWQYDPLVSYKVTIGSQIDLLMLIESLELNNITVLSANTDGLVCLFNKELEEIYYKTCKEWEILVGNNDLGQLEYVDYSKLIQTSVNDYIAIYKDSNKSPKLKGDFMIDFELHKDKSARIIPIALLDYFYKGIDIEDTILNHSNIFNFCSCVKSKSDSYLIASNPKTLEEVKLQKTVRYYISNNGINLLKRMKPLEGKTITNQLDIFGNIDDGTREQEVEAGWLSTIYNKHEDKNIELYDINYEYYINSCYKIIKSVEKSNGKI